MYIIGNIFDYLSMGQSPVQIHNAMEVQLDVPEMNLLIKIHNLRAKVLYKYKTIYLLSFLTFNMIV